MMNIQNNSYLGIDFTLFSTIWIFILFSLLYIFRKKIFKFYYSHSSFDLFTKHLQEYVEANHSKIKFNFDIIKESKTEQNPDARKYIIIDNLINQFIQIQLDSNLNLKPIQQNQLWDSYIFNSKPDKNKLPPDWAKRKVVVLRRDNNNCQRCGMHTKPENAHLFNIKSIKNGGQYYLENLIILCNDCYKISTNKNTKYLDIRDNLNSFV